MKRTVTVVLAVVVVIAVLVEGGFYLFERHDRGTIAAAATVSCAGKDTAATSQMLPSGLPLTQGATVLRVASQGSTTVAFASLPGGREDLVAKRDAVVQDLTSAGYRVTGTDQEPTYEAEAQFTGPKAGSLRVKPLCTGLLELRYTIDK